MQCYFYIKLTNNNYINLNLLGNLSFCEVRTFVINLYIGKDIQLNCSALLNEDGYIYWNFERENGPDPNVQEENGIRIRYVYVKYGVYQDRFFIAHTDDCHILLLDIMCMGS